MLNLGTGNDAKTIKIGTGTAGNTIQVGTDNTIADTITIGSALDALSLASSGLNLTTGGALTGVASVNTVALSATSLIFAGAGSVSSTGSNAITIDSGTTGAVNIGTGSSAKTINIGTGNAGDTINIGTNNTLGDTISIGSLLDSLSLASTGLNLTTGGALTGVASVDTIGFSATSLIFAGAGAVSSTGANDMTIDSGTTGAVNIGTGTTAKTVTVGNTTGATATNINSGTGNVNFTVGATSASSKVQIGNSGTATPDVLVLDNGTADPTGTNGAMYYNTSLSKFRCYQNGAWANCIGGDKVWVPKSSDQAVTNSTTLTSDSALTFSVGSGETWVFSFDLYVTNGNSNGPDFKAAILGAAGWTCSVQMSGSESAGALFPQNATTDCDNAPTAMVDNNINADASMGFNVHLQGSITTNSAGSVTLQFAENTAAAGTNVTVKAGSFVEAFKVGGADLAEMYYGKTSLTPGTVVSIDPDLDSGVKASTIAGDRHVLGVVTTKPGLVLGGNQDAPGVAVLVALTGRVPVNVSTENGPIHAGDFLMSSSHYGVAMRASEGGMVIGQALTGYNGEGVGQVLLFVKNTYAPGELAFSEESSFISAIATTDGLATFLGTIQTEAPRDPIALFTEKIASGTRFMTDLVAARVTVIRGYFDEVFAKKVHSEQLCMKKLDGSEVCVNGEQMDTLLHAQGLQTVSAPTPSDTVPSSDTVTSDLTTIAPTDSPMTISESIPATDAPTIPVSTDTPVTETVPEPVTIPEIESDSESDSDSDSDSVQAPEPESEPAPEPAPAPELAPAPTPADVPS